MKIVAYARGRVFKKNIEKIGANRFSVIVDKSAGKDEYFQGIPVVEPKWLLREEFDCILIFSNALYEDIKMELMIEYGVSEQKIFSWRTLVNDGLYELFFHLKNYLREYNDKTVLGVNTHNLSKMCISKRELSENLETFDLLSDSHQQVDRLLYDNCYSTTSQIRFRYDLVVIMGRVTLDANLLKAKKVICLLPISEDMKEIIESLVHDFSQYGKVNVRNLSVGFLIEMHICQAKESKQKSFLIYEVVHKPYNFYKGNDYAPIGVGGYREKGWLQDSVGDNIAYLNSKINECTALYWIWKNTSTDVVGLCHYRRYLSEGYIDHYDNYLKKDKALEWLETYDVILNELSVLPDCSIEQRIHNSVPDEKIFQEGRMLVYKAIKKYHPEDYDLFCEIMQGNCMYGYHMFVMKKTLVDEYCNWLFPMLIETAEAIDVDVCDAKSKRVIGYFAECLLTVWIAKRQLNIKTLPLIERRIV